MNLHVFNPENDLALADFGKNFIPPRSAVLMRDDLAVLPLWWANEGVKYPKKNFTVLLHLLLLRLP